MNSISIIIKRRFFILFLSLWAFYVCFMSLFIYFFCYFFFWKSLSRPMLSTPVARHAMGGSSLFSCLLALSISFLINPFVEFPFPSSLGSNFPELTVWRNLLSRSIYRYYPPPFPLDCVLNRNAAEYPSVSPYSFHPAPSHPTLMSLIAKPLEMGTPLRSPALVRRGKEKEISHLPPGHFFPIFHITYAINLPISY